MKHFKVTSCVKCSAWHSTWSQLQLPKWHRLLALEPGSLSLGLGVMMCRSVSLVRPGSGTVSVMPQPSDCPHHSLRSILLHPFFQQTLLNTCLWIGIILCTETRTVHEGTPLSPWAFLPPSAMTENRNEKTNEIQKFQTEVELGRKQVGKCGSLGGAALGGGPDAASRRRRTAGQAPGEEHCRPRGQQVPRPGVRSARSRHSGRTVGGEVNGVQAGGPGGLAEARRRQQSVGCWCSERGSRQFQAGEWHNLIAVNSGEKTGGAGEEEGDG